jgi:hypothetical protein
MKILARFPPFGESLAGDLASGNDWSSASAGTHLALPPTPARAWAARTDSRTLRAEALRVEREVVEDDS